MSREQILIVEDEKLIRWAIRERLQEEDYQVREAATGKEALAILEESDSDLLLLDYRLPDITGLQILEHLRKEKPEISAVMMTAFGTVETAVQAMKFGAFDYLTKPVNMEELLIVVQKALEATRLRREVVRLRAERRETHGRSPIVGKTPKMLEIMEMIQKIARSQASTVLLEGESGTGKDLVAKIIHYTSNRAEQSFVNITCSALAESLLESELFGHERGAFTDAKVLKKGLLEVADHGTAFLDEIGEMGPSMQAKLLRFLEEKAFKRVGGTRDIRVDVRVIAATNRVLEEAVRTGRFREDLFYRLKVIPILIPPLRERREDVPLLVDHFIEHFNREFRKNTAGATPDALEQLTAYSWPGNIRELRNVIERVMILEDKEQIELVDLPASIRKGSPVVFSDGKSSPEIGPVPVGSMSLEEMERRAICQALSKTNQNQVRAAKLLGISRDALRYRMKKFNLFEQERKAQTS